MSTSLEDYIKARDAVRQLAKLEDEEEHELTLTQSILILLAAVILLPLSIYVYGFTCVTLMRWFLLPVFPAFHIPSYPVVVGLGLLIRYATYSPTDCEPAVESKIKKVVTGLLNPFLISGAALLFGWILLKFM